MTVSCPACGEPVEAFERVGAVTYRLRPCGHQVDERTRAELRTDDDPGGGN